jgi:hypothetical protein
VPGGRALDRIWRWAQDGYRLAVGAITAAVAAFLLVQLHAWPPHEDETLAFFVSRQPLGDVFGTVLGERGGAPLHFLFSHLVTLVAPGLTGLRLVSVVFAVASVPIMAALVARLTDRRTALLATLLVAGSWALLLHGVYARMYSLFLCTSVLSFLLLLRALENDRPRRWALWGLATLALIASQPYGVLVLVIQAAYVLARRLRRAVPLRRALVAFVAVLLVATPLWRTYLLLASRFDVGFGERNGSKLGSPLDVLSYLWSTLGDFSAGWLAVSLPVGLLALLGLVLVARTRPAAALLATAAVAVPAASLMLARSGSSASLETRHLIFVLPFFGLLVATGLLRLARLAGGAGPLVIALGVAGLLASQVAWGWHRTPWLYEREPAERRETREAASAWLAATSRPDDVLFGYEPLYLDAWEDGAPFGDVFVPRADPRLALRALREAEKPLGRGVWVLDASDQLDSTKIRLEIERRSPGGDFDTRDFGPFLVVRTKEPVETVDEFLTQTIRVQNLSWSLGIGDAGINFQTAATALQRVRQAQ